MIEILFRRGMPSRQAKARNSFQYNEQAFA